MQVLSILFLQAVEQSRRRFSVCLDDVVDVLLGLCLCLSVRPGFEDRCTLACMDETRVSIYSESIWFGDKLSDALLVGVQVDEIFPVQDLAHAEKGDDASSAGSSFGAFACSSVENCEHLDLSSAPGTAAAALLCPAAARHIAYEARHERRRAKEVERLQKKAVSSQ